MKDLIYASPTVMETFQDFCHLLSTTGTRQTNEDHTTLPQSRLDSYQQYNNERNDEATPRPHIINRNNRQLHINPHISHTNHNHTKRTANRSQTHSTGIDKTTQDLITDEKQLRKLWQRTRIQHYKTEYNKLNNKIKHRNKTIKTKNWHNIYNDLELIDNRDNTWYQQIKQTTPHIPPH